MNYLPKGFRDYTFHRADALNDAARLVGDVYARWGYRRFVPSAVEDAGTFSRGAGAELLRQSFRFADRSGEMLVLRPDMTLQAARVIAGELAEIPPPIRLSYSDRVFRNGPDGKGDLREVWQAGIELAGAPGPEADAEILAATLEALTALGAGDLQVDLGHAGFVRDFMAGLGVNGKDGAKVVSALEHKSLGALRELEGEGILKADALQTAKELIQGFGLPSVEALEALALSVGNEAVAELKAIVDVLKAYGVNARLSFDPGEVRGFDYYTGFFFHIYSASSGVPLAAGGRYDGLLKNYGRDLPAVGCAIDLAAALPAESPERSLRVHIVNLRPQRDDALRLARSLREKGVSVSRDIVKRPWTESLDYARLMGIDKLVVLDADATQRVLAVSDGASKPFQKIDELL
jgi:ATP phosphoribosyltransferase regulatory subunit